MSICFILKIYVLNFIPMISLILKPHDIVASTVVLY